MYLGRPEIGVAFSRYKTTAENADVLLISSEHILNCRWSLLRDACLGLRRPLGIDCDIELAHVPMKNTAFSEDEAVCWMTDQSTSLRLTQVRGSCLE